MPNDVETAAASPSLATPSPIDMTSWSREERQNWRNTGKQPGEKTETKTDAKAEPSPAKESSDAAQKAAETASDSETDKQQEQNKGKGAEARIRELNTRTKAAEARAAELERKLAEHAPTKGTEGKESPQAAPEKTVQPAKLEAPTKPIRPVLDDPKWKDYGEYEKAERQFLVDFDKYIEDVADYKAKKAVEEDRAARAQEESQKTLAAELVEVKKRYPDFEEKAVPALKKFFDDPAVPDFIKGTVGSSDVKHDLIYALGEPETWAKIVEASKTDPRKALKAIFAAEDAIAAELGKAKAAPDATERDENGKFVAQKAPEKTATTRQPKPTSEVSGRGTDTEDPEMAAARTGLSAQTKASWDRRYAERHK